MPPLRPRRLAAALSTLLAVLALTTVGASTAAAQRRGGGGQSSDQGSPRGPASGAESSEARGAAKRLQQMASLKEVLAHVDGLARAQKDSLGRIEKTYHDHFHRYGDAMKKLFGDAGPGGKPDLAAMRRLEEGARSLRSDELTAARAVLTTDEQRTRFDANVAAQHGAEAKPEGA